MARVIFFRFRLLGVSYPDPVSNADKREISSPRSSVHRRQSFEAIPSEVWTIFTWTELRGYSLRGVNNFRDHDVCWYLGVFNIIESSICLRLENESNPMLYFNVWRNECGGVSLTPSLVYLNSRAWCSTVSKDIPLKFTRWTGFYSYLAYFSVPVCLITAETSVTCVWALITNWIFPSYYNVVVQRLPARRTAT